MAFASLLTLLDDISTILDDVATMTKVASSKTAGVLGDDLALNAQQVSGVRADRELAVVWAVAKGSALNKLILVPLAILISAIAPWAITPLLVLGGIYLCFEGVEKLAHRWMSAGSHHAGEAAAHTAHQGASVEAGQTEREKIRGAIRTDFILSAEIIVIALGTVAGATLPVRIGVLTAVAVIMTVGVYGAVAAIVKLDAGISYVGRRADYGHPAGTDALHVGFDQTQYDIEVMYHQIMHDRYICAPWVKLRQTVHLYKQGLDLLFIEAEQGRVKALYMAYHTFDASLFYEFDQRSSLLYRVGEGFLYKDVLELLQGFDRAVKVGSSRGHYVYGLAFLYQL
jgi:predicted DNA repair protein MutK